jgi:hypothetical protein
VRSGNAPRRRQNVHPIQPLRTIHLRQHLIDDTVRYSRRIVSSVRWTLTSARRSLLERGRDRENGTEDAPLRRNRVKLVEEQNTRFRSRSTIEQIPHLFPSVAVPSSSASLPAAEKRLKERGREGGKTHTLLTRPNVLVQDLGPLDRNEVESALLRHRGREEGFTASWEAVEEKSARPKFQFNLDESSFSEGKRKRRKEREETVNAPGPQPQRTPRENRPIPSRPLQRLPQRLSCLMKSSNVRPLGFGFLKLDVSEGEGDETRLGGGEVFEG